MPARPATGKLRAARRVRGFTLLEMLLALAIMAIAVAGATLALHPDEARLLASESERLALLLEQAREESELGGMPMAWVAVADRYEFQRRESTEAGPNWVTVRGDELLHPRQFPDGVRIHRVEQDGQALAPGERVELGPLGAGQVVVELALGAARTRITAGADRFQVQSLAGAES